MRRSACVLLLMLAAGCAKAQDGYFSEWFQRVDTTQAEQPHWITPVATTTPRLEEEFRYDILWNENAAGLTTRTFGGGNGLELIPWRKVEVIVSPPPYVAHDDPLARDGFGDVSFLVKYRLLSADEEHGNYILTAFLGWSLPSGQYANGARHAVITPTIAYGKGFGDFDLQGTFGVALPTADTSLLGRTFPWNNAVQYRVAHKFWPEVEVNSTFFQSGSHGGNQQVFITPGLVIGKLHLYRRLGLTVGGGYQIAASHFHLSNHNAILSVRFPF